MGDEERLRAAIELLEKWVDSAPPMNRRTKKQIDLVAASCLVIAGKPFPLPDFEEQ